MVNEPPVAHKVNYVHSWLEDKVFAQQCLLDHIVEFSESDFGGAHSDFPIMITCVVSQCGLMLRTFPIHICRPYLAIDIDIEIVYNDTGGKRFMSLGPPCFAMLGLI
jgi:hypothetical protein